MATDNVQTDFSCCEWRDGFDPVSGPGEVAGVGFGCIALAAEVCNPTAPNDDDDYVEDTNSTPVGNDYSPITITNGEPTWSNSAYGVFIPIVYGSDRLPGNVIWASPFVEDSFTLDDKVYTYYRCNFAAGFCEGEIAAVLRIWAGDQLIANYTQTVDNDGVAQPASDGFIGASQIDLVATDSPLKNIEASARTSTITIFNGSETQIPQGVMAAEEGYEGTPAYRGLSYILFENFIADGVIPAITIEVLSNTTGLYPRLYWDFPVTPEEFDQLIDANWIHYDPSYDQFLVRGRLNSDASKRGFIWIDGNTLETVKELEVVTRHGLDQTEFNNSRGVVTPSGHIVMLTQEGNQGTVRLINGVTGSIDDTLGPGGGLSGHDLDTGFGAPRFGVIVAGANPYSNLPQPVLAVSGSINKSLGFATIDSKNQFKMRSTLNGLITYTNHLIQGLVIGQGFANTQPVFSDGASTQGSHVYIFSWTSTDKTKIAVQRATVLNPSRSITVLSPELTDITDGIPYDQLSGSGYTHQLFWVILDPVDNCFILGVSPQVGSDYIFKWSPFTGNVVWKCPLPTITSITPHVDNALLAQQQLGVYSGNKLYIVNTVDGTEKLSVDNLAAQSLNNANSSRVFYLGRDNSLTWTTSTSGKRLTKVFLERISRSAVTVSSIVTDLLERIGITTDLLVVDDLTALTLDGYTINSRKSLRTIFSELAQVFKFDIYESDGRIYYRSRGSSSVATIPTSDMEMVNEDGWLEATSAGDFARNRKINLTYRDIDRDYGDNVQSYSLPKSENTPFDSDSAIDVTVPMVLDADTAKLLAEILLYSKLVYEEQYVFTAAPKHLRLDPSDVITITSPDEEDVTARVRVSEVGNDRKVKITASREDPDIYTDTVNLFGATGRYVQDEITNYTPRVDPLLLNIAGRTDAEIAFYGSSYLMILTLLNRKSTVPPSGAIVVDVDSGTQRRILTPPRTFPTWGFVEVPLRATNAWSSTDTLSEMIIDLANTGPISLASAASLEAMIDNAAINLAYVGGELIQFQTVTSLGGTRYKLTNVNRAKFGTEEAVKTHQSGEPFVLLSDNTGVFDDTSFVTTSINLGASMSKIVRVSLTGSNNPYQPKPLVQWVGRNLRPRAVTSFVATYGATDLTMEWQRRSRYGNDMVDDGSDDWEETEPEEYTVYLYKDVSTFYFGNPSTYLRKLTLTTNGYVYDAAAQTADGFDRTTEVLYVTIAHSGSVVGEQYGLAITYGVPPKG